MPMTPIQFGLRDMSTYTTFRTNRHTREEATNITKLIQDIENLPEIQQALSDLKPLRLIYKVEDDFNNSQFVNQIIIEAPDTSQSDYLETKYTVISGASFKKSYFGGHFRITEENVKNLYLVAIKEAQENKAALEKTGLLVNWSNNE